MKGSCKKGKGCLSKYQYIWWNDLEDQIPHSLHSPSATAYLAHHKLLPDTIGGEGEVETYKSTDFKLLTMKRNGSLK